MRTHPSPWILGAAIASLTACAPNLSTPNDDVVIGEGEGEGEGEGGEGEGEGEGEAGEGEGEGEGEDGAALYALHCASCHGVHAEGGAAPRLDHWDDDRAALITRIDTTMPLADAGACVDACAQAVADFVLTLQTDPDVDVCADVDLDSPALLPRPSLRLLTRQEYQASVNALLELRDGDDDGCGQHTFRYDPPGTGPGANTVHVAGDFNGWTATSTPASALRYDSQQGLWAGTLDVGEGEHQYKFVVDGSDWRADPLASASVDDGFGGRNSVVIIRCAPVVDVASALPPDQRPSDFAFSGHADSGIVTPVHVDEYLAAAARAVDAVDVAALFGCSPSQSSCRDQAIRRFGRRAFRRPLSVVEEGRFRALYDGQGTAARGAAVMLQGLMSSPKFLYRSELGADVGDGTTRLDAFELAAALAFTLTGAPPDDALLDAAATGALSTTTGLRAQAERLLDTPRARRQLARFANQWLGTETVSTVDKAPSLQALFGPAVRVDLADEAGALFTSVMFDGSGRYGALLSSTTGFISAQTAPLYGLSVSGPLAEHALPSTRRGILGLASVMATTAHSDQTSPIRRGLWVRRNVLCQEFGTPPANAGGVPDVDPTATTRERFAQHTADPACASCHKSIDPIGFGFESFDPIGRFRSTENGRPIDHQGDMVDVEAIGAGTSAPFDDMATLAETLSSSAAAERCFVRQVTRFAYGRELEGACARRRLEERFAASGGDLRTLFVDVVTSPAFALRRNP